MEKLGIVFTYILTFLSDRYFKAVIGLKGCKIWMAKMSG